MHEIYGHLLLIVLCMGLSGFIILISISFINQKINVIMSTQEEFSEVLGQIKTNTENIATDITTLTDKLAAGGLTADEEANVLTELRSVAGRLKEISDITPDAQPPAPEEPTEPTVPEEPAQPEV